MHVRELSCYFVQFFRSFFVDDKKLVRIKLNFLLWLVFLMSVIVFLFKDKSGCVIFCVHKCDIPVHRDFQRTILLPV